MVNMKKSKLLYFIPVLLWMAVIFWFSANNGDNSSLQSGKVSYMVASVVDKALNLDMSDVERMDFSHSISFIVRKTAHFTEYFILGLLLYIAISMNFGAVMEMKDLKWKFGYILKMRYFFPVLIVFFYAMTDEIHQYFVPDRCCSFKDVLIDTAGGFTGILIVIIIRYIRGRIAYNRARHSVRVVKDENM